MSAQTNAKASRWYDLRPWHTNAALIVIGLCMIRLSVQLNLEDGAFYMGNAGVAAGQVVLYLGALLVLRIKPSNVDRVTFPIILAVAIACRLVMIFYPFPFLSTDIFRYVWDGVVQHAHINPFRYVPGNPALTFLRAPNQDIYENINRRDYAHTIYPPVAQICFYLITFLSPTVEFMKAAMVLFEGLTLYGLVLLLRVFGLRKEQAIIYAWCPLLIWEIGSSGHVDSIAMAFLAFAFLFRTRERPVLTGLFLGLAFLTKFYPIVLFPALYRRGDWKMPATIAALTLATYTIYLSAGRLVFGFLGGYAKEEGMDSGARYFLLDLAQRVPGLHALPSAVFLVFAAGIFLALTVWSWRVAMPPDSRPGAFLPVALGFAVALMLLFSPHYPWYVAWLVPLLVLLPNLPVLTYTCGLFYLCYTELAVGYGPQQFKLNEILYSAIAIAALIEFGLRKWPRTRAWFNPSPAERLPRTIVPGSL